MSNYSFFAKFYDGLTSNVDYQQIAKAIDGYVSVSRPASNILLDVACGTGTLTEKLLKKGYDLIGADASAEMLNVAREKCSDVLFLNHNTST